MHEIAQLLMLLVAYYATFGIMAVGFAMMVAGPEGASAAGNVFFMRPVRSVTAWSCTAAMTALAVIWSNIISVAGGWIGSEIKEVGKDLRWLVTRQRGWVWRR